MIEFLKSIRRLHMVLLSICSAIVIFGISPKTYDPYVTAFDELEMLRSTEFHILVDAQYNKYLSRNLIKIFQRHPKYYTKDFADHFSALIDVPWSFDSNKIGKLFGVSGQDRKIAINEYLTFFNGYDHQVLVFEPHFDNLDDYLDALKAENKSKYILNIRIAGEDGKLHNQNINARIKLSRNTSSLNYHFTLSGSTGKIVTLKEVKGKVRNLKMLTIHKFLETSEEARPYRDKYFNKDKKWFPALDSIREEVGTMMPVEASKFLRKKLRKRLNSMKKQISFFGLNIDGTLVILLSPLVAFLVLLYLLVYVYHLKTFDPAEKDFSQFPWIVLFKSRISMIITHLSVVMLPSASLLVLLVRSNGEEKHVLLIGYLFLAIILFIGFLISRQIHLIKKQLNHTK